MIAACSVIIAINIFEIKQPDKRVKEFYNNCKIIEGQYELNV
jgi:hypothetical protein